MIDQNILYAECPCGSGKKFKFCCYPDVRDELPRNATLSDVTAAIRQKTRSIRRAEMGDGVLDVDIRRFHKLIARGLQFLQEKSFQDAERTFLQAKDEFSMFPTAYNNLALCELVQGHVDKAEALANEVVRRFPMENPFGMALLADIYYLKGNIVGATDIIERAVTIEPPSVDQAARLCESMAHFQSHEQILAYTEKSGFTDDPEVSFYRGIAFANLGQTDEAIKSLRIAARGLNGEYAQSVQQSLEAGRKPPSLCRDWLYFTPQYFTLFAGLIKDISKRGSEQLDLSSDIMAEFLEVEVNAGSIDISEAIRILPKTVCKRTERILRTVASDASRPNEVRNAARAAYKKIFSEGDVGKKMQECSQANLQQMVITEQAATHEPLDPAYEESYLKAVRISLNAKSTKADLNEALRLMEDLHAKVPENPAVTNNYASVLDRLGRKKESANLLRECFAQHPEYVFGAANYLMLLIQHDAMDEAKAMISHYRLPQKIHPDAYMAWCRALTFYYDLVGDNDKLRNVKGMAELIQKKFTKKR